LNLLLPDLVQIAAAKSTILLPYFSILASIVSNKNNGNLEDFLQSKLKIKKKFDQISNFYERFRRSTTKIHNERIEKFQVLNK
jgi:hypothetical protein